MKHNLKTFPKAAFPVSQMTPAELLDHILKLVTWKSHFKEELRQMLGEWELWPQRVTVIKDVLGEK